MSSVTRKVFRYYFTCKRKAQLQMQAPLNKQFFDYDECTKSKIIQEVRENKEFYEQRFNNRIKDIDGCKLYFVDAPRNHPDFYLKFDSSSVVVPIIVIPHLNIKPIDRQELVFSAINLAKKNNEKLYDFGFIIFSPKLKITKVKFSQQLIDKVKELNTKVKLQVEDSVLKSVFIKHECKNCRHFIKCSEEATKIKHLSLLPSISQKRILELRNRGIFTWEQLSYTYRAQKGKSHTLNHIMSLRALAIRQNTVFVNEYPNIPKSKISIFFDVEGLPHENFNYLIGMVVVNEISGKIIKEVSYWANNESSAITIIENFLDCILVFQDATFFHYGSYEIDYLKSNKGCLNDKYQAICNKVIDNSFNVLSVLRTHVIFPTFSNGLKDITKFLKFCWPSDIKNGYDSIKARIDWQGSYSEEIKKSLIKYNLLDCLALRLLTIYIRELKENRYIVKPNQIEKHTFNIFWRDEYAIPDMKKILAHAYFDYQREKVSVSFTKLRKKKLQQSGYKIQPHKPNTVVELIPASCPSCNKQSEKSIIIARLSKKLTDIKFTASGVKRWVTLYQTTKLKCACGATYHHNSYPTGKTHVGFNVKAYIVYQYIFNGLSFSQIKRNLQELFSLKLSGSSIFYYKEHVAQYFRPVYKKLLKKIISSNVIYIDETPFKLEEGTVYGWLLSNGKDVVTLYREDRSSDFLVDLLGNFEGVIVCDFYSAYDRLDCKKQRCLIHLIRDMNSLLLRNPEDTELKVITSNFTELLSDIVKDIELRAKTRKWYLNKFKKSISACLNAIEKVTPKNIETRKLHNRVLKYWDELFEFVNHNDIHWNNTVAEHAIKLIATHRNKNLKYLSKKKIEDYMTILTIYQNCQMKDKSFLRFLLNQKPEDIL